MKEAGMGRRNFLCIGAGAVASMCPGAAKAANCEELVDFDNPAAVVIKSEGAWRPARSGEVSVSKGVVRLKTNRASWVRIVWPAAFRSDAKVLCDAWERGYGNLSWRPFSAPWVSPWYFSVREGKRTRCIGMRVQPSALGSWSADHASVTLLLDVRCGCLDTLFDGRETVLAELVQQIESCDVWDALHAFCKKMCPNPVLPDETVYGGDDWYAYYSDNSADRLVRHAKMLSKCAAGLRNRSFQVVDAGWQLCHGFYKNGEEGCIGGPYRYCNSKFGSMKDTAARLRDAGVRPGIWIRPLQTLEYVPDAAYLNRMDNVKYLDPTHPVAREILDGDIRTFREWGYELIKWDFLVVDMVRSYLMESGPSVAEGDWSFHDRAHTTAEICLEYYRATARLAAGAYVNTCNTFSHLTAGIFPGFRIGDDTSGTDWNRTVKMGVNTMAFRAHQDRAFYLADCDCVGITDKIPWKRNREWLRLLRYSGTPLTVSIQEECFTAEVQDAVTESFAMASVRHPVARPLDWDETLTPRHWQTFDGVKHFDWE